MNDRPKIKIPFEPIDIIIELVSIALLIFMWSHVMANFNDLPETIASHFNAKGLPDGYSSKQFLWFLPGLATLLYAGICWINRYPHLHNYMINITEKNAFELYRTSTKTLRVVNMLCVLLFAYISYNIVEGAKNEYSGLGWAFFYVIITVSILLPIVLIVYQLKLKKKYNG